MVGLWVALVIGGDGAGAGRATEEGDITSVYGG